MPTLHPEPAGEDNRTSSAEWVAEFLPVHFSLPGGALPKPQSRIFRLWRLFAGAGASMPISSKHESS